MMGMADNSYPIIKKALLHLSKAKAHSPWSEAEQQFWESFFACLLWFYDIEKVSLF